MKTEKLLSLSAVGALLLLAGCKKDTQPGTPGHIDYVCKSYYGYVNGSSKPITVEFRAGNSGLTPPRQDECFTVHVNDKYEIWFAGFGIFPGPFAFGKETYVKVSCGEKQFVQHPGDNEAFLFDPDSYELLFEDLTTRVYEYRFTNKDFADAETIPDKRPSVSGT